MKKYLVFILIAMIFFGGSALTGAVIEDDETTLPELSDIVEDQDPEEAEIKIKPKAKPKAKRKVKLKEEAVTETEVESKPEVPAFRVFLIYEDKTTGGNHYAPSGWMGDYTDLKLDYGYTKKPHAGKSCIRIEYNVRESQRAGWAGMFWQNPSGNWGEKKGGYNLTGATKLTFWARGAKGNEKIKKFKVGGISGTYPDSCSVDFGPVVLRKKWRKYTINLKNRDLSYINGGFCSVAVAGDNPSGIVFYLDDIKFE
ncbi:MAG: hypothetical protein PHR23_06100 [bacterium]|nr:hypothetical protein [bacterium]